MKISVYAQARFPQQIAKSSTSLSTIPYSFHSPSPEENRKAAASYFVSGTRTKPATWQNGKKSSNVMKSISNDLESVSHVMKTASTGMKSISNDLESVSNVMKTASNDLEIISNAMKIISNDFKTISNVMEPVSNEMEIISNAVFSKLKTAGTFSPEIIT
jgi:methyl-accepting chemotaxis protein